MCTAGCNDTVQEWEEEREREKDTNLSLGSQHSHIYAIYRLRKLPPDNWTLPGRIFYTFLRRTCAGLCIVAYDFTQVISR